MLRRAIFSQHTGSCALRTFCDVCCVFVCVCRARALHTLALVEPHQPAGSRPRSARRATWGETPWSARRPRARAELGSRSRLRTERNIATSIPDRSPNTARTARTATPMMFLHSSARPARFVDDLRSSFTGETWHSGAMCRSRQAAAVSIGARGETSGVSACSSGACGDVGVCWKRRP